MVSRRDLPLLFQFFDTRYLPFNSQMMRGDLVLECLNRPL